LLEADVDGGKGDLFVKENSSFCGDLIFEIIGYTLDDEINAKARGDH
jgi:hypothetical protein